MDDAGAWLSDLLREVRTVTRSEAFRSQIEIVRSSIPWLGVRDDVTTASPVLLGLPNRPLAPQLARRWEGRRFTTVKIFTGSTDVDGAFLLWAHKTFGVKKATVCLTPSFASFDAKQLAKLPLNVRFVERDQTRRVHAKLYWFSGPDGEAAVMGSANCSAAAWLASHENGNVELVTVYDTPQRAAFAQLLSDFDGKELLPKDVLIAPVKPLKDTLQGAGSSHRITSIRLRASDRRIEALVEPMPAASDVTLVIETKHDTLRIRLKPSGGRLVGYLAHETVLGPEPIFATMEISSGSARVLTPPRWIDNERALENAARERHVDPNDAVLSGKGFGGASEQRIMEAIQAISSSLLNFDTSDHPAYHKRWGGKDKPEAANQDDVPVSTVDPSSLTYSLNSTNKDGGLAPEGGAHGISLGGVMKMLFAVDEEPELEIDLSQERWSADEPEKGAPDEEQDDDPDIHTRPPEPRSDAETAVRLREQIDEFLFELAKPGFAERCPASVLAQAAVFPVLLGIKGQEEGWFSDDMLASIACRVVAIMFARRYGAGKPVGLLQQVRCRHVAPEQKIEFAKAVGDGALYTVLLAALAKPQARSLASLVQQADAITHVMNCPDLVAFSDPTQRSVLIQKVIIHDADFAVRERAGMLAAELNALSTRMEEWDRRHPGRSSRTLMQPAGSVMWSTYGWEVTPREPAETYWSGINIDTVKADDTDIANAVDALWRAMREGRDDCVAVARSVEEL
jgi:hypothetical protein